MALAATTRLGPYEIVAPLGAGGMGEVYMARDARLGRTVAVKILPSEFAGDLKFKFRFEREARAISALSHPHICALYDVGPEYLVMEYCEGKTLARRLAAGPLHLEQVIEYGIQIADALDKAHRAGIVHRDLKPGNIMITKSGVKLLDFGLAKQQTCSSDDSPAEQVTAEERILGTIPYMAPELLQGKEADTRSDIFAFGLVLYEMATGRPAFSGTSKPDLIAAILEHDPAPVEGPPALGRLIRACLEKDPNERLQSAHDAVLQLRWLAEAGRAPEASGQKPRWKMVIPAAVAILALGGIAAWQFINGHESSVHPARFQLQPPPGVAVVEAGALGVRGGLAVSPDGEWVAFSGRNEENGKVALYLRSTQELEARLVMGSAGGSDPFFSPDSKWLGFVGDGFIQRVAVDGGQPTRICSASMVRGASWGEDGTILFSDAQRLIRVPATGGEPRSVTAPRLPERHIWPQFLPGGRHAVVTVSNGMGDRWRKIGVLSLADGHIETLVPGTYARYAGGRIVYAYTGTLFSFPFNLRKLKATAEPKPVLDDVYFYSGSGRTGFDLSRDGSLVYMPGARRVRDTELVWVDRQGRVTPAFDERRPYIYAELSPDGKRIAVTTWETVENRDLWVLNPERGISERLTVGMEVFGPFTWSPGGRSLIFASLASGLGHLYRIAADGSGRPQQLTSGINNSDAIPTLSADGATLVFRRVAPPALGHLMQMSLTADELPRAFVGSSGFEDEPSFSPDGRWLAYTSDEAGGNEIQVRPFPAREPRVMVSSGGGERPVWSADGRELFYRKGNEIWSVAVATAGGFHAGAPRRLFAVEWLHPNADAGLLQPSLDGKKFLTVRPPVDQHRDRRIVYAPNWIEEVRERN